MGTGGIGKTSLAKAILHDSQIKDRFKAHRSFIPLNDLLPSQITYPTFINRVCRNLGVPASGTHGPILEYLERQDTLLVIDNADTILDPEVRDVSRIKAAIDEFGALTPVSILLTSRSRELPRALCCEKVEVPNLDSHAAYKVFTKIYTRNVLSSRSTLESLLSTVGYHPLTITLLAHVAEVNEYSVDELDRLWNNHRTHLLNMGHGKDENLADSIEISLNSPCFHAYANDVRRVLRIIAFFPQGVPQVKLKIVFPSIPLIQDIVNVLRRQSLILLQGGEFITMLVPIRLYINDAVPTPDAALLGAARNHYYSLINEVPELDSVAKLIKTEDVNIESLLAFDLQTLTEHALEEATTACKSFIFGLYTHKSRPTFLTPIILALDTSHSRIMTLAKLDCFYSMSSMARVHGSFVEALEFQKIMYDLAQEAGEEDQMLFSIQEMANTRLWLGQYRAAWKLLEDPKVVEISTHAHSFQKGYRALITGDLKQCTDTQLTGASLAALYQESSRYFKADDSLFNAGIGVANAAYAYTLIDKDLHTSRNNLESAISYSLKSENDAYLPYHLSYLAAVASIEGEAGEAKQLLNLARVDFMRMDRLSDATRALLALTIYTLAQGEFSEAEDLLNQAYEESKAHPFIAHQCRWWIIYTSGALALVTGGFAEAYQLFKEAKRDCERHQEFQIRAFCTRAMGEVAYLQKNMNLATTHFEETMKICEDAGIVPGLLYRRMGALVFLAHAPPATYKGWFLFLQRYFTAVFQ